MKKIWYFCALLLFFSCAEENAKEKEIAGIPLNVNLTRFDQVFLNATPSDLPKLKETYPMFFPSAVADSTWIYTMRDPLQQELKQELNIAFENFDTVEADIKAVLQHIKYYFPEFNATNVYTVTTEDYRKKVIIYQDMILIALNTYLGQNHKYYEGIQQYITQSFEKDMIPVDIADEFAYAQIPPLRDRSLVSKMIYHGKAQFIKSLLVPDVSQGKLFNYTETQMQWAIDNEAEIWTYFVERELLYSTDNKLDSRFINVAPFSKFYLEIDNQSPGSIGRFIGYQIVEAFMKNNDVSLQEMLQTPAKELFTKSKYKPKK